MATTLRLLFGEALKSNANYEDKTEYEISRGYFCSNIELVAEVFFFLKKKLQDLCFTIYKIKKCFSKNQVVMWAQDRGSAIHLR